MATTRKTNSFAPLLSVAKQAAKIEHWDDERTIGNGILVTLKPGLYFYDDCGVMAFDTEREARAAIAKARGES